MASSMEAAIGISASTFVNLKSCRTLGRTPTATTGRVECRDIGDVEDVERRALLPWGWFEFENIDHSEWFQHRVHVVGREAARELEDEDASFLIFNAFDSEFGTLPQLGSCGQYLSPWIA
jgi:hypothetical protein